MIRAILFDLDQTLIDRTATFARFLTSQYQRFEYGMASTSKEAFVAHVLKHDQNGYVSKDILYPQAVKELSLQLDASHLVSDFKQRYGSDPILFPRVRATLERLARSFPLAIVTNGRNRGQNAKIDRSGIRSFFKSIKISEEEGVKKPDPEIYLRCADDLAVSPNECLFVGDNPELDVLGAINAGLKAVWLRNPHFAPPTKHDGIIDSLSDLATASVLTSEHANA